MNVTKDNVERVVEVIMEAITRIIELKQDI